MNAPAIEMISPCVKLCRLDPTTHSCVGCGRTLDEIGNWSRMSHPERARVMLRLALRKEA